MESVKQRVWTNAYRTCSFGHAASAGLHSAGPGKAARDTLVASIFVIDWVTR